MHFNDLPDKVLALVFRAAQPAIKRQLADVKDGLRLLSVCKRWREVALPLAYDTVVIKCDTDRPARVDIKSTLNLMLKAKCLHVARKVALEACYRYESFQGLEAVIDRLRRAAGEWTGVDKLYLNLHACEFEEREPYPFTAGHEKGVASVNSALAALMPGLREIELNHSLRTPVVEVLYGRLVRLYANQLQVLHSCDPISIPRDRVYARLRDVAIRGCFDIPLKGQLPWLDSEVIESLALTDFTANDMWSMFCADSDGCEITFPRLTNLNLTYLKSSPRDSERPWALKFPAVKHIRISCRDEECPSIENAVFPDRLESLDISECLRMLPAFAGRKVQVSWNLALPVAYNPDTNNSNIDIANRMLTAVDCHNTRTLRIGSIGEVPPELFAYTRLTHLHLDGQTSANDVMELIHRLPHLVGLHVYRLTMADTQTDFSIPRCTRHEPVAPLATQLKRLTLMSTQRWGMQGLGPQMVKYLLLKIPTLKSVTTQILERMHLRFFAEDYVKWYPHLANLKHLR